MSSSARLTFAPTSKSADAFFLAGMSVADEFIAFEYAGRCYGVASALELGNFKNYGRFDEIFSLEALLAGLKIKPKGIAVYAAVAHLALKKAGALTVVVGKDAPVGFCEALREFRRVNLAKGALFPERLQKNEAAIREIRKSNKGCAAAIEWVGQQLHSAVVKKGKLYAKGSAKPLTSEILRIGAKQVLLANEMDVIDEPIIAGGLQGCDPHAVGSGALRANELIVVDIFEPLSKSGYWGDMTRTFLKGQPSDAQASLVRSVAKAQKDAIKAIKPGVSGKTIHSGIVKEFEKSGYATLKTDTGYVGFFHGTGHSLGLECHDLGMDGKGISKRPSKLLEGEVYTVEPGLYYPEIGGCRIEDNGVVTAKGFKLLSRLSYDWVV